MIKESKERVVKVVLTILLSLYLILYRNNLLDKGITVSPTALGIPLKHLLELTLLNLDIMVLDLSFVRLFADRISRRD